MSDFLKENLSPVRCVAAPNPPVGLARARARAIRPGSPQVGDGSKGGGEGEGIGGSMGSWGKRTVFGGTDFGNFLYFSRSTTYRRTGQIGDGFSR